MSGSTGHRDPGPAADQTFAPADIHDRSEPPVFRLTLRPHRSLGARGVAWLLAVAAAGLSLPLLLLSGKAAAWGMLPFAVGPLLGLYWALRRNFDDGRLTEQLSLWPDLITVVRREPRGAIRRWHANPFWVQVRLLETAPIEKYLTLRGGGREIELGAFLTPDERIDLHRQVSGALARVTGAGSATGDA